MCYPISAWGYHGGHTISQCLLMATMMPSTRGHGHSAALHNPHTRDGTILLALNSQQYIHRAYLILLYAEATHRKISSPYTSFSQSSICHHNEILILSPYVAFGLLFLSMCCRLPSHKPCVNFLPADLSYMMQFLTNFMYIESGLKIHAPVHILY